MLTRLRFWLIRKLMPTPDITEWGGRKFVGDRCMVMVTPPNIAGLMHDAVEAFHCGGHTFFFYDKVTRFPSYRDSETWTMKDGSVIEFKDYHGPKETYRGVND